MIPMSVSDCVKLILQAAVILMVSFRTSGSHSCVHSHDPVIIRNVGIKLCQFKSIENRLCLSIQYNIESLTCRLMRTEPSKTKTNEGCVILAKNHSDIPHGGCASNKCNFGQRCLENRSGKVVCGQATPSPATCNASRYGDLESARRILSAGHADTNIRRGHWDWTPLMVAAFCRNKEATPSPVADRDLYNASRYGDLESARRILKAGDADINSRRGQFHWTPVMVAAFCRHREVVTFLVDIGADVSQVDKEDNNILILACIGGDREIVELILSLDLLDINARNIFGLTAVNFARKKGHQKVVMLLVLHGAL